MTICKSAEEALKVPDVVHVEAAGNDEYVAYTAKDELPEHCKPQNNG